MTDATSTRKSGRQRVPNRKYLDEPIETLNEVLTSDSDEASEIAKKSQKASKGDVDFRATAYESPSDSDTSASSVASSDVGTPVEDYEDAQSYASGSDHEKAVSSMSIYVNKHKFRKGSKTHGPNMRSRGIEYSMNDHAKRGRLPLLSGPGQEFVTQIVRAAEFWANDVTLPSRSRLRYPVDATNSESRIEGAVERDSSHDTYNGTCTAQMQRSTEVDVDLTKSLVSLDVLLGPYRQQKLFSLFALQAFDIDIAWHVPVNSENDTHLQDGGRRIGRGWMLNVGDRVRSMEWAPHHENNVQYLAIATTSEQSKRSPKDPPSFTALGPTPSSIQLWAFEIKSVDKSAGQSDNHHNPPKLAQLLCSDWGDAKQLQWCPWRHAFSDHKTSARVSVGALAAVFDDGFVRVIDVTRSANRSTHTSYVKLDSAAITIPPLAHSICTCLSWLSVSEIAIGHSNGFLATYPIGSSPPNMKGASSLENSRRTSESSANTISQEPQRLTPQLITRLHQSYIITLASAYPLSSSLLASTSISGYSRLTSLTSSLSSYVETRRTHLVPVTMAYHHSLFGFIFPEDGREQICFTPLRNFGYNIGIAEANGLGGVPTIEVGKTHAAVAFGTADGRVIVTNPIKRLLKGKEPTWQQIVFRHEWAPNTKQNIHTTGSHVVGQGDNSNKQQEARPRKGISRITEGYKAQIASVDRSASMRASKTKITTGGGSTSVLQTIFEEETGVTSVCWNPNIICGGWLAAAWGSGLVRVQNVAI